MRVDGAPASKSLRLAGGELIELEEEAAAAPAGPEPGSELEIPLAFSDEHVIVVDKPAGVVTHPAPGVVGPTLVAALRDLGLRGGDDEQRPGVIHRLDRDTSGLLVMTRSDEAYAALGEQMRARAIEREYVALVRGRPPSRRGTIDAPIGRDRNDVGRMAVGGRAERAGGHALRAGGAARRLEPAAPQARDGPHASDPRPPGRDRPPRDRRPRSTASPAARSASAASSCTRRASRSPTRSTAAAWS